MTISHSVVMEQRYSAPMNMAIDEALLLDAIRRKRKAPLLRFYDWERRSISIGYFQKIGAALELAEKNGCDFQIVRRMTGGGIVLHGNDITFSLVISEELIKGLSLAGQTASGVVESYRPVNEAALKGILNLLGKKGKIALSFEEGDGARKETKFCFASPTRYDVVIGGRKIAGGAQRRTDGYILYQGSMLLRPEPEDGLRDFFKGRSVTLEELKMERLEREEVTDFLTIGFSGVFGRDLVLFEPDEKILEAASLIAAEKYGKREWNYSR